MTVFRCQGCGAGLSAQRHNARLDAMICAYCGSTSELPRQQNTERSCDLPKTEPDELLLVNPLTAMSIPKGFRLERREHLTTMYVRVGSKFCLFGLILGCWFAWIGFSMTFLDSSPEVGIGGRFVFAVLMALGAGAAYTSLADLINTTRVSVDSRHLMVRHKPLPCGPAPTIERSDIERLYIKSVSRRDDNSVEYWHYNLCAVTQDQRDHALLTYFDSREQIEFAQTILEGWLSDISLVHESSQRQAQDRSPPSTIGKSRILMPCV